MATTTSNRAWHSLARITALAVGAVALAGCATGYNMVQPNAAGSGSYYTSNGPYGDTGYYDDDTGSYYAGGGYGSPYFGFGGFGYGYPGFGTGPWLGASPWFGLGLGSACGWTCGGFYGNPFYTGFGYPFGWGSIGYIGYRHHHYGHHGHSGHGYAWNGSHPDHPGWDHGAWGGSQHHHGAWNHTAANDGAWHRRNGWNARHPRGAGAPGIEVEGQAAPADFASRRALPSAGFVPQRRPTERAFSARGAVRMSELVGPPAMAPGLRDEAAFSRPAAVPMVRPASGAFGGPTGPAMQGAAPSGFRAPAAPVMRPMAPMHFSAPPAPAMRAMPSAPVRGARPASIR